MDTVKLGNHFKESLFKPALSATTKKEVLEELLDLFADNNFIKDKHLVLEMLYKRETMGSTALGKGVAIPHGRTIATADMIIAFGRSETGIDFDASDGKPVTLFFMIIAPPNDDGNVYLPVLGSLVTILKDANKRKKLNSINTFEELLAVLGE